MKLSVRIFGPVMLLAALTVTGSVAQTLDVTDPLGFFTNAASRFLSSELNLNLTRIEIYPTNQYTPAVQRLLQVAANIYDATSTNYYPTIFRPLFSSDASGNLFITGYINVPSITDSSQLVQPIDASTLAATLNASNLAANVYGVPWIIAAKKGFPNFNAFVMENVFQITRKLQLTRPNTTVTYWQNPNAYTNSQQLTISMTNLFGVECWNSYLADYTNNPVRIIVKGANTTTLVNDEGLSCSLPAFSYTNSTMISDWPGYGTLPLYQPNPQSFIYAPLEEGEVVIPGWVYTFDTNAPFVAQTPVFYATNNFMPQWTLLVTNRLQVVMLESNAADASCHVIDYVQLIGPETSADLTAAITNIYDSYYDKNNGYQTTILNGYNDMWDPITNRLAPFNPMGIANQIAVSAQMYPILLPYWYSSGLIPVDVTNQTAAFRAFLGFGVLLGLSPDAIATGRAALNMQAPYTPTALVASLTHWEANDPLVHYLASDLAGSSHYTQTQNQVLPLPFSFLNDCYRPWGGNARFQNSDQNPNNHALKDPLVYSSDAWNFPTGQALNLSWLGQVHRGTPWQTIYLKATDILATAGGLNTWTNWTGDPDAADAAAMAPVQDRHLLSILASVLNTNDLRQLVSVNNSDSNAWLVLLDGLTALTNDASGPFDPISISSNSPQASIIASGIQASRSGQPNQFFHDAGDILATPQLAEQSPFLSGLNPTNQITDEAYEVIPSQLLSLVRADSVGSVASAIGPMVFQFSGYDGHSYAIEVSSDLVNWTRIATNYPANGIFTFTIPPPGVSPQLFRSVLLQ